MIHEIIVEIEHKDYMENVLDGCREIVRCKDCKYSSPNRVYGCRIHSFADDLDKRLYADDYCSYAERKEHETD